MKSSEPNIVPADPDTCYGWAYQPCGLSARFELTEYYFNGSWSQYSLCVYHAAEAMNGVDSEAHPPVARVWRGL